MNLYRWAGFPILRLLSIGDAERAHEAARKFINPIQDTELLQGIRDLYRISGITNEAVTVAGIHFPNRVGLAAGLDKQGDVGRFMETLGFGFEEVGTVTPRPQSGNPRPRIVRLPKYRALCNWMGFNSDGANAVAKNLSRYKHRQMTVGGSIGKNATTPNERAVEDYKVALDAIAPQVDYLAANVSSPNTKNLRDLQYVLRPFLTELIGHNKVWAVQHNERARPIFVKFAPDLTYPAFEAMLGIAVDVGADGVILTNTTKEPPRGFKVPLFMRDGEGLLKGGYSGSYTFPTTCQIVKFARRHTKLPIIAVGGVWSGDHAVRLLDQGADLVQIYTSFIYQGPKLVKELRQAIARRKN